MQSPNNLGLFKEKAIVERDLQLYQRNATKFYEVGIKTKSKTTSKLFGGIDHQEEFFRKKQQINCTSLDGCFYTHSISIS